MAAEQIDEDGDQDPEPDHPQEDHQDRPERTQDRIRVGARSEQHGASLARMALQSAAGLMVNASIMIVLGTKGRSHTRYRNRVTSGPAGGRAAGALTYAGLNLAPRSRP